MGRLVRRKYTWESILHTVVFYICYFLLCSLLYIEYIFGLTQEKNEGKRGRLRSEVICTSFQGRMPHLVGGAMSVTSSHCS